jgi:hypothetical protein
MDHNSRRITPLLVLLLLGIAVPSAARPLQVADSPFGAVEWESLATLQKSAPAHEPDLHFGPILGAMFLRVGDAEFLAPIYGGSVRRDAYTLFLGDGRIGADDRLRFGGLRYGLPTGLYVQVTGVDARQVISEYEAYTHRATGAMAGVGYERLGRRFHGSLSGGGGGFQLVTPKQVASETSFGFYVAGHAGFTF